MDRTQHPLRIRAVAKPTLLTPSLATFCLAVSLLCVPATASAKSTVRGPWTLVSLAALGKVTWRCDASRRPGLAPRLPGLALGFDVSRLGQTGSLRLRANGRTVLNRVIQPGQSIQLPYLPARVQRLEIEEGGEDGTLRATVTVDFAAPATSNYCWPYMPPSVEVQLQPRH
jgi:hypothetical protein